MQKHQFDISKAPVPPLRAEPRLVKSPDQEGHIRGVEASPRGLVRATLASAAAAGAILVLFWLPAEYGIDATGLGRVMGLTEMGEIKLQLNAEAAAEDAASAAQPLALSTVQVAVDSQVIDRLVAIEVQLAAIAQVVGAVPPVAAAAEPKTQPPVEPEAAVVPDPAAPAIDTAVAEAVASAWQDEVSYTLAPGEGVEVKLVMEEGAVARFEWAANGGVLNYDTHGDGGGNSVSYEQGRGVPGQAGELKAAFTGNHGWFWRNRSETPVTITLRTAGDYNEMKLP